MAHRKWLMAINLEFPQASVIIAQRGGLTISACHLLYDISL
jgi:hypothetical protein